MGEKKNRWEDIQHAPLNWQHVHQRFLELLPQVIEIGAADSFDFEESDEFESFEEFKGSCGQRPSGHLPGGGGGALRTGRTHDYLRPATRAKCRWTALGRQKKKAKK